MNKSFLTFFSVLVTMACPLIAATAASPEACATAAVIYPKIADLNFVPRGPVATDMAELERRMKPYTGVTNPGADPSTLNGKVMAGYQGWFAHPDDGAGIGYFHYGAEKGFRPGFSTIEMWPDMSEMDADEKYPTLFRLKDGSVANVFSSYNPKTVARHFRWMAEYGIDGVFVQRFGTRIIKPRDYDFTNGVLDHCRAAANQFGRTWTVMYDVSGLKEGEMEKYVIADWKRLGDLMKVREDRMYQRHEGKPVLAIWGLGLGNKDLQRGGIGESVAVLNFLKNDPVYGGNSIVLGIPLAYRTPGLRDASWDPRWAEVYAMADVLSPWTIGRYKTLQEYDKVRKDFQVGDVAQTRAAGQDYLPVIFPGFSWQNLMGTRGKKEPQPAIARLRGEFFRRQAIGAHKLGTKMVYVAMFDEMDEATSIFKITDDSPVGANSFLGGEGLPSDYYLRLCGELSRELKTPEQKTNSHWIRRRQ